MRESTPRSSALTRLAHTVERVARALFARPDRQAQALGWDVTVSGRWGTSRTYHDPRYDRLASCPRCGGRGEGCGRCHGTGRIVLEPARTERPVRSLR
jgi:hypothetical protein